MFDNNPLWLVIFATALALVPIAIGVLTSYVKVNIILGFLKSGLGAQQVPGNLVIMALSMALTTFIMSPVISSSVKIIQGMDSAVFEKAPKITDFEKFTPAFQPWKEFMESHSGKKEIEMLKTLDKDRNSVNESVAADAPKDSENKKAEETQEVSLRIIIPAFVLTEIKASFMMGFMVLLPFLVIDLVVANILAGMGMYMLSPVIVSLPIKLILFVMSDGWLLLTRGIIQSY